MKRATLVLAVALIVGARDHVIAQRDGGDGARQGGAGPRAGGGFRGAGGGPQGRGAQGGVGRGRGAQVQGTSSIRGLVTAGDTNTPVRRAQVTATSADTRSSKAATTDANGRFELLNLPAGRWTVNASKGGFVSQQFGQRRSFEAVEPIDLADGQRFTANFTLARGGVITGRISDEYGDPVTGARVEVLRSQMVQGRRRLAPVSVAGQTDDTGAFRAFGLAPGEYYVAARAQPMPFDGGDGPSTFAPTYFPGTGSVAEAQRITVEANGEQSGINFALLQVRAVRVSGTVVDANGAAVQAMLSLTASSIAQGPFNIIANSRSGPDGTFTIPNVAPGEYTLDVTSARGGGNTAPDVATMPLVVGNEDVSGISIVTSKGGSVRGTVVADNGARPNTTGLQVTFQSLSPGPRGFAGGAQVSNAGTFELTGLAGSYVVRVDRIPQGWTLRSITINGRDVSDSPVDVRGSDQLVARVVLTDRITELTGTVRSGSQVATNANVIVFPEDPAQWPYPSRRVRTTRVDANGLFRMRALPGGVKYLAVAVDYLEQGEFQDPEFLQRMKARATAVTLGDGETRNIELPLIER